MISDLIGSTTEPVIRKRISRVAAITIASAIGRCCVEARLEVDEVGGGAADQHGRPRRWRQVADRVDGGLARLGGERVGRDDLERGHARRQSLRRRHLGDAFDSAHRARELRCGFRAAAFDVDPDRGVVVGRELAADRVVGLARARRVGQHGRVDGVELDRKEGQAEDDQEERAQRRHRDRSPHDEAREPVPEALLRWPRVGLGAPLQELRRAGVDPGAEQGQHRGQDGQRDQRREQRHQCAAEAHRVEEALREDEQRGERGRDGQRGEEDRAPGRRHHPPHRLQPGSALGDLLAVAGDDEEAVVDRQPEPERRRQVEGEDRDRAEFAGDPQDQEGADDRQTADHQRQDRGDEAAEEEQREQEEQREGQHLGLSQVFLDLLVDLLLGDREAADDDPGVRAQLVGDLGARRPGVPCPRSASARPRNRSNGRPARRRRGSGCRSSR